MYKNPRQNVFRVVKILSYVQFVRCSISVGLVGHIQSHVLINDDKMYQCSTCEKKYQSTRSLRDHLRSHSGGKPYQCPVCKEVFTAASNLSQHKRIHSSYKPFECSICGICLWRFWYANASQTYSYW